MSSSRKFSKRQNFGILCGSSLSTDVSSRNYDDFALLLVKHVLHSRFDNLMHPSVRIIDNSQLKACTHVTPAPAALHQITLISSSLRFFKLQTNLIWNLESGRAADWSGVWSPFYFLLSIFCSGILRRFQQQKARSVSVLFFSFDWTNQSFD